MANNTYRVEYAASGRALCKETSCKQKIAQGTLRIGKTFPSDRFTEGGMSTDWYHVPCMFKALRRARKNTKRIENESDLENIETLSAEDKNFVLKCLALAESGGELPEPSGAPASTTSTSPPKKKTPAKPKKSKATPAKKSTGKTKTTEIFRARLVSEDAKAIYLDDGSKILGRGDDLGITDKLCSRKQAELIMDSGKRTLNLITHGTNPGILTRGSEKTLLEKGKTIELKNGDEFTLVGQKHSFTVQTRVDQVTQEDEEEEEEEEKPKEEKEEAEEKGGEEEEIAPPPQAAKPVANKRKQVTSSPPPEKAQDAAAGEEEEAAQPQTKKPKHEDAAPKPKPAPKKAPAKKKADIALKREMGIIDSDDDGKPNEYDLNDGFLVADDDPIIDFDDAEDDDDEYKGDEQEYVGGKRKCWYGAKCYQKNPKHHKDFWHPPKGGTPSASPMKKSTGGGEGGAGGGGARNYDEDARVLSDVIKGVSVDVIKAVLRAKNGSVSDTINFFKDTSSGDGKAES